MVGAYAVGVHGHPRATKDLDIWIDASPENAGRVMNALRASGAPLGELDARDFETPGTGFMMGKPPRRIDVLTQIDGVRFADVAPRAVEASFDGVPTQVIGFEISWPINARPGGFRTSRMFARWNAFAPSSRGEQCERSRSQVVGGVLVAPSSSRLRFIDLATSSETLRTWTLSPAFRSWTPSRSMMVQKGQAVATVSAPEAMISSVRLWFTRVPIFSSIHIRPPPAPQQKPCSLLARQLDAGVGAGGEGVEDVAGGIVFAVPAPEVAGVVEGQLARAAVGLGGVGHRVHLDLAALHQLANQLGVVADLEVAAQLRVLVLDRMQAVRAGGDDLLHLLGVHQLDVLLRFHLVQHLVAGAPRRIAGAAFFQAQHGEIDAPFAHHLDERAASAS